MGVGDGVSGLLWEFLRGFGSRVRGCYPNGAALAFQTVVHIYIAHTPSPPFPPSRDGQIMETAGEWFQRNKSSMKGRPSTEREEKRSPIVAKCNRIQKILLPTYDEELYKHLTSAATVLLILVLFVA